MSTSFGFSLVGLSLAQIKQAKELCSVVKRADVELTERLLRLENSLIRFTHQINFLDHIKQIMDEHHQEIHEQTLTVFLGKLKVVIAKLQRVSKPRTEGTAHDARKVKYAFEKENIDKAIDDLSVWQATSDQSWFLLMRIAGPLVDKALATCDPDSKSNPASSIPSTTTIRAGMLDDNLTNFSHKGPGLSLGTTALKNMNITPIPLSDSMMIACRTHSDGKVSQYILNRLFNQVATRNQVFLKDARDLIRKMQHDEPHTFGLLQSKGFVPPSDYLSNQITLVFRHPPNASSPRSLRELLVAAPPVSLSQRFKLAKDLAKAVGYVHTFGFVHKNVCPESVLVFSTSDGQGFSAFLAGFGNARLDEGLTQRQGDETPERNLYRHPSRQGLTPEEIFVMQHDIYSLGVCLLEIGLWGTFVDYSSAGGPATLMPLLEVPATVPPGQISKFIFDKGKEHLLSLAQSRLCQPMGDQYAEIVQTCLTCLDPGNADFGDESEFQDEDGIRVGARYIEKVLFRLNAISV